MVEKISWRQVAQKYKTAWSKMPKRSREEWDFFIDANGNIIASYPDLPEYIWVASKRVWVEIPDR